jgi:hypothetical protein
VLEFLNNLWGLGTEFILWNRFLGSLKFKNSGSEFETEVHLSNN